MPCDMNETINLLKEIDKVGKEDSGKLKPPLQTWSNDYKEIDSIIKMVSLNFTIIVSLIFTIMISLIFTIIATIGLTVFAIN